MPLYDYDCAACGRRFEVIHGVHADSPDACPLCGSGPVRKAVTAPAVHFKGSGWAKKERRSSMTSSASGDKDGSDLKSSDSKSSDSKASDPKSSGSKEPAATASASSTESSGSSASSTD